MGWAVGYDPSWERDIGYGVPSVCDYPGCSEQIDRGLAYVCGGEPYGGSEGCGLFFCENHLLMGENKQQCERCIDGKEPFDPTPDTAEWIEHKANHPSWQRWRDSQKIG